MGKNNKLIPLKLNLQHSVQKVKETSNFLKPLYMYNPFVVVFM